MRTEIKALSDNIEISAKSLKNLSGFSHTSDEIAVHVKITGAALERFLKDAVYNSPTTRDNLVDLINRLSNLGISNVTINAFHDLRLLYNSAKHNAAFTTTVEEIADALEKTALGLKEMEENNISNVNRPYKVRHNRILWFSAWDHYTSGETEISIFLPQTDTVFPHAIEHFNIRYTGWDLIKSKYCSSNELLLGESYLPNEIYNFWTREGDFINAGIFKGDLKELVSDISKHIDFNIENRLLPGLKREEDFMSVKCAVTFSLLDAFKNNSCNNITDLKEEIFLRSAYDYGINISSKYLRLIIDDISHEVFDCDKSTLDQIDEIVWTNKATFAKQKIKQKIIPQYEIFLNEDNKIVCHLNNGS